MVSQLLCPSIVNRHWQYPMMLTGRWLCDMSQRFLSTDSSVIRKYRRHMCDFCFWFDIVCLWDRSYRICNGNFESKWRKMEVANCIDIHKAGIRIHGATRLLLIASQCCLPYKSMFTLFLAQILWFAQLNDWQNNWLLIDTSLAEFAITVEYLSQMKSIVERYLWVALHFSSEENRISSFPSSKVGFGTVEP